MTSVNGNATARGHTVDIDESFFEIVEKSNSLMALMGYFEARKGPFALVHRRCLGGSDLRWPEKV